MVLEAVKASSKESLKSYVYDDHFSFLFMLMIAGEKIFSHDFFVRGRKEGW